MFGGVGPNDGIKNVSIYWDTHSRNFIDLKDPLMSPADLAFSTLLDDLESQGLLDKTTGKRTKCRHGHTSSEDSRRIHHSRESL